jgi:hypothetical protein
MNKRTSVGLWTSLILGLYGLIGSFYVFVLSNHWMEIWIAKAEDYSDSLGIFRVDEVFVVKYVIPALHDLAVVGSAMMIAAAYMFFRKHKYAWNVALIGNVIAIQGTAFPIVAAASARLFPEYSMLFLPIFLGFFVYIGIVHPLPRKLLIWGTVTGMAYVLTLFNGVASASRMAQKEYLQNLPGLAPETPMFAAVQQINWLAMIAWGIFLILLMFNKRGIIPIAVFAAILGIIGGLPLGIDSMAGGTTFSMFLLAPIMCLILLVYFLLPSTERFVNSEWQIKQ